MFVLKGLAIIWGFALVWLVLAWAVKGWIHMLFAIPAFFLDKGNK